MTGDGGADASTLLFPVLPPEDCILLGHTFSWASRVASSTKEAGFARCTPLLLTFLAHITIFNQFLSLLSHTIFKRYPFLHIDILGANQVCSSSGSSLTGRDPLPLPAIDAGF